MEFRIDCGPRSFGRRDLSARRRSIPADDGHDLELAIEVRGPVVPPSTEGYRPSAEVIVFHSRSQPAGELRLDKAMQVEGRWVVPATVPLQRTNAQ